MPKTITKYNISRNPEADYQTFILHFRSTPMRLYGRERFSGRVEDDDHVHIFPGGIAYVDKVTISHERGQLDLANVEAECSIHPVIDR